MVRQRHSIRFAIGSGTYLSALGIMFMILGVVIPSSYDMDGVPHGFLNTPVIAATIIIVLCLLLGLVGYAPIIERNKRALLVLTVQLIISITIFLAGTVIVVAWTIAVVSREVSFGLGLYVMFIGAVLLLVGSIASLRNRKNINNTQE